MEIVLMRHGRPDLVSTKRLTAAQMKGWIESYDLSVIEADSVSHQSVQYASSFETIVCSTSARAVSSVVALGKEPRLKDKLFCEAGLPYANWKRLRLSPNIWAAFFRLAWFVGYSNSSESLISARLRAKAAADRLVTLAASEPVLLVGHGFMNRLIAKELVSLGFRGPRYPNGGYWGCSVYRSHS